MIQQLTSYIGKLLACLVFGLLWVGEAEAQRPWPTPSYTIPGPTSVSTGISYTYRLTPAIAEDVTWSVSCGGRVIAVDTKFDIATIVFDGPCKDPVIVVKDDVRKQPIATLPVTIGGG